MNTQQRTEIERFLTSGEYDSSFQIWYGNTFVDQAIEGSNALRNALIAEVFRRVERATMPTCSDSDLNINARAKFSPMVRGLFPLGEQSIILDMLDRSVIFLTPENIIMILEKMPWLGTAWDLANLYLASVDAKLLADTELEIVGLSEGATCYVSMKYFSNNNPFDDFVIHEAAHIFHNCKRVSVGLPATKRCEWLLDIDFAKRETFAYACEAYSQILQQGKSCSVRTRLVSKLVDGVMPPDERVDAVEYVDILREAVSARNGWRRILDRCSSAKSIRRACVLYSEN